MNKWGASSRELLKKLFIPALAVALLCVGVTACGGSDSSDTSATDGDPLAEFKENGVKLGMTNLSPMTFQENGEWVGESIDIAEAALAKIGIDNVEHVAIGDIAGLIPSLQAGRTDIVADLVIKPERCEVVDFTSPYLVTYPAFAVSSGDAASLTSFEDVRETGWSVGILAGSVDAQAAASAEVPASQIKQFPDLGSAFTAMKQGRVKAVSSDQVSLVDGLDKAGMSDGMEIVPIENYVVDGEPAGNYSIAFAVRSDAGGLLEAFNEALDGMIPEETAALGAEWGISADGYEAAVDYTTEGLCAGTEQ